MTKKSASVAIIAAAVSIAAIASAAPAFAWDGRSAMDHYNEIVQGAQGGQGASGLYNYAPGAPQAAVHPGPTRKHHTQ